MVFDISKKFLIFEKNHLFGHFFGKKRGKFIKNPDRPGKEKVVSTGRYTGRSRILYRTGPVWTGRLPVPVTTLVYDVMYHRSQMRLSSVREEVTFFAITP
jgi:hypothetical protein